MASSELLSPEQLLLGVVALLAADREDRIAGATNPASIRKTELVLADAGLSATDISKILNKKPNSVAKTITRARAKGTSD